MFKIGDYVVYCKRVCKIEGISENRNGEFYALKPIDDESLSLEVPTDNRCGHLRALISVEEAHRIIDNIPNVKNIDCNPRVIENEYKRLLNTGNYDDLVSVIKTTYSRNKERTDNHKKTGDKDNYYFEMAEKYLYNELAIVLGMTYDEAKQYVIDKAKKQK